MAKSDSIPRGMIIVKVGVWRVDAIFVDSTVADIRDFLNADGRVPIPPDTEPFVLTSDNQDLTWLVEPSDEEDGVVKLAEGKKIRRLRGWGKVVSESYVIRPDDMFLWFRAKS